MTHLRKLLTVAALAATFFFAAASNARADMIGLTVNGELYFGANPFNYFDPANGFVPAGFLNTAGTSVVIGAADEFGFDDGSNRDTAEFTGTQLIIQDVVFDDGTNNNPVTMIFTAPWLVGASIAEVADSFSGAGMTASLLGDTLTLNWAGGLVDAGAMRAVYDLAPGVPEPATLLLLGAGLAATGLRRRNRKLS